MPPSAALRVCWLHAAAQVGAMLDEEKAEAVVAGFTALPLLPHEPRMERLGQSDRDRVLAGSRPELRVEGFAKVNVRRSWAKVRVKPSL